MIVTNLKNLARVAAPGVTVRTFSAADIPNRWKRIWLLFRQGRSAQHLVLHFDIGDLAILSALFILSGGKRPHITTLDMFAGDPQGWKRRYVRWCVRRVDCFLVYFRDTRAVEQVLDAAPERFHYVPFKINAVDRIRATTPEEQPYIFSGGRSRRDFHTLFDAVRDLPYRVKILTSEEAAMNPHGSTMEGLQVPANVEISRRDWDQPYFIEEMAKAKLVVIPLVKGVSTQAGIGVYIQAMALHKCVIISEGLGVDDVLTDQAVIIPAGDVDALRNAIVRYWENDALRAEVAERGYRYALPLGGEGELARSVLAALPDATR
jgi:glycosyltransferase involved in cell wall biosynthesis